MAAELSFRGAPVDARARPAPCAPRARSKRRRRSGGDRPHSPPAGTAGAVRRRGRGATVRQHVAPEPVTDAERRAGPSPLRLRAVDAAAGRRRAWPALCAKALGRGARGEPETGRCRRAAEGQLWRNTSPMHGTRARRPVAPREIIVERARHAASMARSSAALGGVAIQPSLLPPRGKRRCCGGSRRAAKALALRRHLDALRWWQVCALAGAMRARRRRWGENARAALMRTAGDGRRARVIRFDEQSTPTPTAATRRPGAKRLCGGTCRMPGHAVAATRGLSEAHARGRAPPPSRPLRRHRDVCVVCLEAAPSVRCASRLGRGAERVRVRRRSASADGARASAPTAAWSTSPTVGAVYLSSSGCGSVESPPEAALPATPRPRGAAALPLPTHAYQRARARPPSAASAADARRRARTRSGRRVGAADPRPPHSPAGAAGPSRTAAPPRRPRSRPGGTSVAEGVLTAAAEQRGGAGRDRARRSRLAAIAVRSRNCAHTRRRKNRHNAREGWSRRRPRDISRKAIRCERRVARRGPSARMQIGDKVKHVRKSLMCTHTIASRSSPQHTGGYLRAVFGWFTPTRSGTDHGPINKQAGC